MGNLKWTEEEFQALQAGVTKHGVGKWKNIQNDPEFNHVLHARSNVDLKDKWRRTPIENPQAVSQPKHDPVVETGVTVMPCPKVQKSQEPSIAASSSHVPNTDAVVVETSKEKEATNNMRARLNEMVLEAISVLNEPKGSDHSAISDYVKQNNDVPPNFKRNLTRILEMLVQRGKLEKVECYRLKSDVQPGSRTAMNQEEFHHSSPHQVQSVMHVEDITVVAAAASAACKIAEAENKSFLAAEAVKEAERVSSLAEEMASLLQFATDCYEQSAHGDVLLML